MLSLIVEFSCKLLLRISLAVEFSCRFLSSVSLVVEFSGRFLLGVFTLHFLSPSLFLPFSTETPLLESAALVLLLLDFLNFEKKSESV